MDEAPLFYLSGTVFVSSRTHCSIPVVNPKYSGRVLTSNKNIKMLTEKEEAKQKAQIEWEERKREQEERRRS